MAQTKTGDCEVCNRIEGIEATLYLMHNNIWMCSTCRAEDNALTTQNAKNVIIASRKIDAIVELKADIFVATTKSITDLQAAVNADDSIPADKKTITLLDLVAERIKGYDEVIFAEKAATKIKENERYAFLQHAQQLASTLRESERAKYKQYNVNYSPAPVKAIKARAIKAGPSKPKSFSAKDKREIMVAAAKYNVPPSMIRSFCLSKNWTPEQAAKHVAEGMA